MKFRFLERIQVIYDALFIYKICISTRLGFDQRVLEDSTLGTWTTHWFHMITKFPAQSSIIELVLCQCGRGNQDSTSNCS